MAVNKGKWLASRSGRFTRCKNVPVPTQQEAVCTPEPVWTLWKKIKKKTLAVTGNRIAIHRLCRPCLRTILTEISCPLRYAEISLLFTRHGDSISREPQAARSHVASILHLCILSLTQLRMNIRTFHISP